MQTFWQDIRFGARMLLKNPGFAIVAVLTLSLGIGANTAIFSVVSAVLLRDLPFPDSDRIVTLWENNLVDGLERDDVSPANFFDWRERQTSFHELAFANPYSLDYVADGEPVVFRSALVSKGFFDVLQANPATRACVRSGGIRGREGQGRRPWLRFVATQIWWRRRTSLVAS